MKQQNKQGFALVIALGLTIIMSLLVLYILEYIMPYAKNIKGIENSTNAFYQAESSVEEGLYFFKTRTPEFQDTPKAYVGTNPINYKYNTTSKGQFIPKSWEWNSEYGSNFNTLSAGDPIQLEVWGVSGLNWNSSKLFIRVPDLNENGSRDERLKIDPAYKYYVNWQLSSSTDTLFAQSDKMFDETKICMQSGLTYMPYLCAWGFTMGWLQGEKLDGLPESLQSFYTTNCSGSCILKLSVINTLTEQNTNAPIPYLEYKFVFNSLNVPLRYSRINATGKSYWFQKNLEVRVPQQTVSEWFDFTVFQ